MFLTIGREQPGWKVPLVDASDYSGFLEGAGEVYRLILVESGTGIVNYENERHPILAPAIYCFNEQDVLTIEYMDGLKGRTIFFHPVVINSAFSTFEYLRGMMPDLTISASQDLSLLHPFLDRDQYYKGALSIGPATARRAGSLIDAINQQFTEQIGGWPCRGRSYFLELLFLLGRAYENRQKTNEIILPESRDMEQVVLYLHNHYQENLRLSDLTQIFHINRTTLIERFSKATGGTIKEYLINLRLRLASLMLRDTLLPIAEIMERTGFNDITHFGRMFKRYAGLTPSDYRRQNCWMLEFYPDYQD